MPRLHYHGCLPYITRRAGYSTRCMWTTLLATQFVCMCTIYSCLRPIGNDTHWMVVVKDVAYCPRTNCFVTHLHSRCCAPYRPIVINMHRCVKGMSPNRSAIIIPVWLVIDPYWPLCRLYIQSIKAHTHTYGLCMHQWQRDLIRQTNTCDCWCWQQVNSIWFRTKAFI